MIWERMTSAIMDGCLSHLEAWVMIKAKICASMPHIIWFLLYKKFEHNLTYIDNKTLVMDLTYILSLILGLRGANNANCKS